MSGRKKERKLKRFLDKSQTAQNRIKALLEYSDKCEQDNATDELEKLCENNFSDIVTVALELFNIYEIQAKRDQLLEKSLSINNKHIVRKAAFESLLMFYSALGELQKNYWQLLSGALDMTPFLTDFPGNTKLYFKPIETETILPRDSKIPKVTKEETLELLCIFLDNIFQQPNNSNNWLALLKEKIFPSFYPDICKKMNIEITEFCGFVTHCPYEIQKMFVDKISNWFTDENLTNFLWAEHASLLLGVLAQVCLIPCEDHEMITRTLQVYFDVLFTKVPNISEITLFAHRKSYFELFLTMFNGNLQQGHEILINYCLKIYDLVGGDIWQKLGDSTKKAILITALDFSTQILKGLDTGGIDHTVCPLIIETLLYLWIRTHTKEQELWLTLSECLRSLFHRQETIIQCKIKLIDFTLLLQKFMYSFELSNNLEKKSTSKIKNKRSATSFPDSITLTDMKIDPKIDLTIDPKIEEISWDWHSVFLFWNNFIGIFSQVNSIQDPSIYAIAMEAIACSATILLYGYEKSDWVDPKSPPVDISGSNRSPDLSHNVCLISVFSKYFFDAVKKPPIFSDGKAAAICALCRIFMRATPFDLPLELLMHFYDVIQISLVEYSCQKPSLAVIENTTMIFTQAMLGSNVLIPYYLVEIGKIFERINLIPEKSRLCALIILGSLVCIPYHIINVNIPLDSEVMKNHKEVLDSFNSQSNPKNDSQQCVGFKSIKEKIFNIANDAFLTDPEVVHMCMAISIINILLINEIHFDPSSKNIDNYIATLINSTHSQRVASLSMNYLENLAIFHEKLDTNTKIFIYKSLIDTLGKKIVNFEPIFTAVYDAILEWIIQIPFIFFEDRVYVKKTFGFISKTLKIQYASETSEFTAQDYLKQKLRRAAEQALVFILNFGANWPIHENYGILESQMRDIEDSNAATANTGASMTLENSQNTDSNLENNSQSQSESNSTNQSPLNKTTQNAMAGNLSKNATRSILTPGFISCDQMNANNCDGSTSFSLCNQAYNFKNVLRFSWKNRNIFSIFDKYVPNPPLTNPNISEALAFTLKSPYYSAHFRNFLRNYDSQILLDLVLKEQKLIKTHSGFSVMTDFFGIAKDLLKNKKMPDFITSKVAKLVDGPIEIASALDILCSYFEAFLKESQALERAQERICRATMRDYSGKFTWDFEMIDSDTPQFVRYKDMSIKNAESMISSDISKDISNDEIFQFSNDELVLFKRLRVKRQIGSPLLPFNEKMYSALLCPQDQSLGAQGIQLQSLVPDLGSLLKRSSINPFNNGPDLFVKERLSEEHLSYGLNMEKVSQQQANIIENYLKGRRNSASKAYSLSCSIMEPAIHYLPMAITVKLIFNLKMFELNQYNSLVVFSHKEESSNKFKRFLKEIDTKNYGRETIKVGLVYVKYGQEDQKDLLRNEYPDTSIQYAEFAQSLAVVVDVNKHSGYIGGLDRSGTTGTTAPYYHSLLSELIFHEVTRMPTVQKDPQQILKKRHVGNDIVHLVWTEHVREYNPSTIFSDFNDVVIIVAPLPNGLFRVKVAKKKEVPTFGPLIHGMMVSKAILPYLSRDTTIMANSAVRFMNESYMGQFLSRKKFIFDTINKHECPPFTDFLKHLFSN